MSAQHISCSWSELIKLASMPQLQVAEQVKATFTERQHCQNQGASGQPAKEAGIGLTCISGG